MSTTKQIGGRSHTQCLCVCGNEFWKRTSHLRETNYCSRGCKETAQRTGGKLPCTYCSTPVYRSASHQGRIELPFCSYSCRAKHQNPQKSAELHPNWTGGKASYRVRALRHYGSVCSHPGCVITTAGIPIPEEMLDVHHRDGNRKHNAIPNLQVICVWCHGVETRLSLS